MTLAVRPGQSLVALRPDLRCPPRDRRSLAQRGRCSRCHRSDGCAASLGHHLDGRHRQAQGRARACAARRGPRSSPSGFGAAADRACVCRRASAIPRAHGSYEALLADPDARRGLHPAPESPPRASGRSPQPGPASTSSARSRSRLTAADAERMVEAVRARGRAADGGVHVSPPSVVGRRSRSSSASGRIGRLRTVQSWFSYYNDDPAQHPEPSRTPAAARCATSAATRSTCRGCCSTPSRTASRRRSCAIPRPASTC